MSLRIGILGTARIAPTAVIGPARAVSGAEVVAIASRDADKAERFAARHGIPHSYGTYGELLADDSLNAVYVPLPISLHCEWTIKALEAGKHVLCEKPFACNSREAEQMAAAAHKANRVLMEAFHYRYHPYAQTVQEELQSGVIGKVRHIETCFNFPILSRKDFRYQYELGGGALMDVGCYPVNLMRFLAGAEPEVVGTEVRLASPKVDRWMRADLQFADGRTGRISCSMLTPRFIHLRSQVHGDEGRLVLVNPYGPHVFNILRVDAKSKKSRRMIPRQPSTYVHQLRAFASAVTEGTPFPTTAEEAVKNMKLIDAIYRHAGLPERGTAE